MSHYVETHFPLTCLSSSIPSASPSDFPWTTTLIVGNAKKSPLSACVQSHTPCSLHAKTLTECRIFLSSHVRLFFYRIPFQNASAVELHDLFYQQLHLALPHALYSEKRIYCGI